MVAKVASILAFATFWHTENVVDTNGGWFSFIPICALLSKIFLIEKEVPDKYANLSKLATFSFIL